MRFLFTIPIRLYQWFISPLFPSSCIYHPSCSEYTRRSILAHGFLRGMLMGLMRIGRCSGRFHGGEDPVPTVFSFPELREEYRRRSFRRRKQ